MFFCTLFLFSGVEDGYASDKESFLNSMPDDMRISVEEDMKKRDLSGNPQVISTFYEVKLKDEKSLSQAPFKSRTYLNSDLIYTLLSFLFYSF